jgi:hypothetical protein
MRRDAEIFCLIFPLKKSDKNVFSQRSQRARAKRARGKSFFSRIKRNQGAEYENEEKPTWILAAGLPGYGFYHRYGLCE